VLFNVDFSRTVFQYGSAAVLPARSEDFMPGPVGLPVIDTMVGFPHEGSAQYDFIRKQTKDRESKEDFEFPVEYMFKDVPQGLSTDDPVSLVLQQMDRFGIEMAMIGVGEGSAQQ